jgi:hypothetical protein
LGKKYEKNEKKRRRKKEEKDKKKDIGEKLNKQDYFISLNCVGVTNLRTCTGYKKEEFKTAFNKITSTFLYYTNV